MHPLILVGAVLHGTAVAVVAFFVLFLASKTAGLLKTIGNLLAIWLFIIAILGIVCAALFPTYAGGRSFGMPMMERFHPGWMPGWKYPGQTGAPATPQPAKPAGE